MSDGPSTRDHRITKSYFRTCSTYMSRSQAPLYLYALHAIANRIEGTFVLLRYFLGGDRPSQTARLALSPRRITDRRLESKYAKSGISLMTIRRPEPPTSTSPTYPAHPLPKFTTKV